MGQKLAETAKDQLDLALMLLCVGREVEAGVAFRNASNALDQMLISTRSGQPEYSDSYLS